jgi:hypothetical protein
MNRKNMTTIDDGDKEKKYQHGWFDGPLEHLFIPVQRTGTFASLL